MKTEDRHLHLRVTRRNEPDLGKLIEWVLNVARHGIAPGGTASQTPLVSHHPRAPEQNSRVISTLAQSLHHRHPVAARIGNGISAKEDIMGTSLDTTTSEHATEAPVLSAVSYLRVSTRERAERGGTEEGFSIPAQRHANARKAAELGAHRARVH